MKFVAKIVSALYVLALLSGMLLPFVRGHVNADSTNLIANSSVETATNNVPDSWSTDSWGTNSPTFTYLNTGHTGDHSVKVQMNSYTSGDAKWYFAPVTVTGSTQYTYTDYYQSTTATDVVAQFDNGSGMLTYQDLGAAEASAAWHEYSADFTTPASTKAITILHVIAAVGTLTTDDSSLAATTATGTSPTGNLVSNPSVDTVNPNNSAAPQNWLQDSWGTNSPTFTYLNTGHTGDHSVKVQMNSYTSGDAKWYFAPVVVSANTKYTFSDYYQASVATDVVAQFEDTSGNYTYVDLGNAAASTAWAAYTGSFTTPANVANVTVFHLIAAVGTLTTDDFSLTTGSTGVATSPIVTVTAPAANAAVSGKVTLGATAIAQGGNTVTKVRFAVDGVKVGTADTTAPYSYSWNSGTVAVGSHTVTAIATTKDGATTTSAGVTITTGATASNLIVNPSVETVSTSDPTTPSEWYEGAWGNNTATFSYPTTGHTGSRSVGITMTNFTDGGANWTYDAAAVIPGQVYEFSDYYQANVTTQVIAAVQLSDGTTSYVWLGNPYTSDGVWTKFFATFTMPANAVSAVVYQTISANGYFTADDYDFQAYTPKGFSAPLVSVTFDDGIASQYTNGLPILQKYGLAGTFYVISGDVGVCDPDLSSICYMTQDQVKGLQTAGQEVGSHTVTHPDLTTLNTVQVDQELSQSQTTLQSWLGTPVTDLAAPYGDVNESVLTESQKYYTSQRGVEAGYNSIDNYDQQDLLVQDVDTDTTVAQVKSYIDYAKATNTWLILVFHDINTDTTIDPGYDTTPADFTTEMKYLKNSGVAVQTIAQGLKTVASQVAGQ